MHGLYHSCTTENIDFSCFLYDEVLHFFAVEVNERLAFFHDITVIIIRYYKFTIGYHSVVYSSTIVVAIA